MRKWTLEVLAEQVLKMNEIFEVLAERKYGKRNFRCFAVKTERKQSFRPFKVLAERKCGG